MGRLGDAVTRGKRLIGRWEDREMGRKIKKRRSGEGEKRRLNDRPKRK
jgi:hypothetical protein